MSGGPDYGFVAKTQTVYCSACRTLQDVSRETVLGPGIPVRYRPRTMLIRWIAPWRKRYVEGTRPERISSCPRCGSTESVSWHSDEPCPQCGGSIQLDPRGFSMSWD